MKKTMLLLLLFTGILINSNSQVVNKNQQVIHDVDSIRKAFYIPGLSFGVANCYINCGFKYISDEY